MDYVNDAQNTRFVMSLDALDFGLMSSAYLSKLNSKPTELWSAKNQSFNPKYFEFEIGPKNYTIDSNSEKLTWVVNDITSMGNDDTTTVCHICDIEVPTAYVRDHESSLKHKAYMKITDTILERTRRHMLSKAHHSFLKRDDSMYFCGTCSIALQVANKQNHEQSKAHKQCLSLDRLLYELVALYTHETYVSKEKINIVSKKLSEDDAKDTKSEIKSDIGNETVLISDIKATLDMHEESSKNNGKIEETDSSDNIEAENSNYNGVFKYLHDFSNESTETVQIINDEAVETTTRVETKPINNNTNTNGINIVTDDTNYFCQTCNFTMHVNNIDSHMNGNKHAWNSKSSLHYFMKQGIDSNDLVCKVCNVYVADDVTEIKEHIATSDHVKKYKNLLITNNVIQEKNDLFCKACQVVMKKGNVLYHIEKQGHVLNLASFNEPVAEIPEIQQNDNVNAISGNHTEATKTDIVNEPPKVNSALPMKATPYHCTVCDVDVPNNPYNIKSHNDGSRHENNAKKTISNIADSVKSSNVSSIQSTSEIADSVKSSNVSNIHSTDLHYQMEETENERQLMCKVCKVRVSSRGDCVSEHINGKKHESNLKSFMESNNIVEIGQQYICTSCQVYINVENLFTHIASTDHNLCLEIDTNVNTSRLDDSTKTNSPIKTPTLNKEDVSVESLDALYLKLKHHFAEAKESDLVICKVCTDLKIPNTTTDIVKHATDETHVVKYKVLMTQNLIFESENSTYICGICTCLVPLSGEVHHVRGARHVTNFLDAMKSAEQCHVCDVNITNSISHLTTAAHVHNVLKKQTLLYYCDHCALLFAKSDLDEHARACHKLAVKGKICFCTTCDPYLPGSKRM